MAGKPCFGISEMRFKGDFRRSHEQVTFSPFSNTPSFK